MSDITRVRHKLYVLLQLVAPTLGAWLAWYWSKNEDPRIQLYRKLGQRRWRVPICTAIRKG